MCDMMKEGGRGMKINFPTSTGQGTKNCLILNVLIDQRKKDEKTNYTWYHFSYNKSRITTDFNESLMCYSSFGKHERFQVGIS